MRAHEPTVLDEEVEKQNQFFNTLYDAVGHHSSGILPSMGHLAIAKFDIGPPDWSPPRRDLVTSGVGKLRQLHFSDEKATRDKEKKSE